jgi:hypothetical protein
VTVAETVNVRTEVEWNENEWGEASVYVRPVQSRTLVGLLSFQDDGPTWVFIPTADEGDNWLDARYIDVDPATEQRFRDERTRILTTTQGPSQGVLSAELEGRIEMFRDENRDLATLGAKIEARRWWRELQSGDYDVEPVDDVGGIAVTPAGPLDVPGPDVKARRNYKRMLAPKLVQSYYELIHGGEARRKTLDWRADIPFVRAVMRDRGIDPDR